METVGGLQHRVAVSGNCDNEYSSRADVFSPSQQNLLDRNQMEGFLHDAIKRFCQEEHLVG